MNLNKIFKQVTGIALAGAIAFAGFAGSVNAASTTPNGTVNGGKDNSTEASTTVPTLTKKITGATYFAGGDFEFTIKPVDIEAGTYTGYKSRPGSDFVTIANDGKLNLKAKATEGKLNLNVGDVSKLLPGVYRFQIKEIDPKISGMIADSRTLDLDVFIVSDNGTSRVAQYYVTSSGGEKTDLTFENKFAQEDIVITKKITGNQADSSDKFKFTVKVTPASETTNNNIRYSTNGTDFTPVTTATDGTSKFEVPELGNEGKITVQGLAVGDKIEVTENDDQKRGYTATVDGGLRVTNENVDEGVTVSSDVIKNIADVTWTNNRSANVPTGLIENIGPFVIAILAAGFILFIYFKNNKKEEELA